MNKNLAKAIAIGAVMLFTMAISRADSIMEQHEWIDADHGSIVNYHDAVDAVGLGDSRCGAVLSDRLIVCDRRAKHYSIIQFDDTEEYRRIHLAPRDRDTGVSYRGYGVAS